MNGIPRELRWVMVRASCTAAKVFNQICDGVIEDVKDINEARQLSEESKFMASMHSDGSTIYIARPNRVPRLRATIGVSGDRILVVEEWNENRWDVSLGLNDEGRCILRLEDGMEIEQWQFRKKALEGLFFRD